MLFYGRCSALRTAFVLLLLTAFCGPLGAQIARDPSGPLDALVVADPRLRPSPAAVPFEGAAAELPSDVRAGWQGFLATAGGSWKSYVDRRTGRVDYAEGAGLPWIAGDGKADLRTLEATARAFLPRVATAMGIDPATLVLSPDRSGRPAPHLWNVDFDVALDGVKVEGARVVFRVNNGRLIQFGTENLPDPDTGVPAGKVGRKEALSILANYVGGMKASDEFVDGGTVRLVPAVSEKTGERGLVRVWEFVFRRRHSPGTWRARVDAASGLLLDFRDVNDYASANGGVYPKSYIFNNETVLPMPYADLSTGGFTTSAGTFTGGGSPASTLSGRYVDINDVCGAINLTPNAQGNLAFGTSTGTDCTTPGAGGAGNTHAARTQFYHVNRAKEVGRGWLPTNAWLSAVLPVNVNLGQTCNAYWDGSSVNFFRSGSGCGNTGEIAAVSLHEYGHGLDQNDGNAFSPDNGTGEAYADITAALLLHDSCMGQGFFSGNCGGYGDTCTSCSGVRDVDWAKHVSNTPHKVDNFTRVNCWYGGGYNGPCGMEGHCESYVISEAIWDLANRDLPSPGSAAAWSTTERLWYVSRPTSGSAFVCHNATIPWTSDGCATGSLFRTLRAADDDDGNLANGTPHSCQIYAALNRHGMACASDAGAAVCFAGCTPPAVPSLTVVPGNGQAALSWTGGTPGAQFEVYRSETSCDAGFQRVAAGLTGSSYTDYALGNGMTYYYRLVSHGYSNVACAAPPTACQSVVPQEPPCNAPPPAPASVTATALGVDRISVSWSAVPGAIGYRVFRADSAGGPFTQVATLPASPYVDGNLPPGTTRYYRVRAATGDSCVSADSATASATTVQCQAQTLYQSGFENPGSPGDGGLAGWTLENFSPPNSSWRGVQACTAHGGSNVLRFGGSGCFDYYMDAEHAAVRPPGDLGANGFTIPAGAALSRLSFWHRREFEWGYDGGTLKISVDGGTWVQVPATALSGQVYDRGLYYSCVPSELSGTPVFTGSSPTFAQTTVDLDAACTAAGASGCGGHTVRIAFETITDCTGNGTGWSLDDVSVNTCIPHGCTGAPTIGTAATPADNQVQVNWSNGAPASTTFNVYRAPGTCAAPGPFSLVAHGVSGTSYLDNPVSGGLTWAYRVAGLDGSGFCESDLSGCVQASPTGPCTAVPAFAGLAGVDDQGSLTCALTLAWTAATARCGGPVTYEVFRGTSPDFVPSAANRIATGLTGTTFQDSGALSFGTAYHYVVRAVDGANGQSDGNTVHRSATPTGPLVLPITYTDTFEDADGFQLDGWTHAALSGSRDWDWSTATSHGGTHSWHAGGEGLISDRVLTSPTVRAGASTVLSFWHTFRFESCFDGGVLDISVDGGPWTYVSSAAFLSGGYTGTLFYNGNPLGGLKGWCEGTVGAMTQVRVDLSSWAGHDVQVRWHMGEDGSVALEGWSIDDVAFENTVVENVCRTAPPAPTDFYTTPPCRLVDTREANAPNGGPVLQPGQTRTFVLTGACGIPADAKALSLNVTVVNPGASGFLSLFPADQTANTSTINFQPGVNRANNTMITLSAGGGIQVKAVTTAPVHLLLDVNGWFQE